MHCATRLTVLPCIRFPNGPHSLRHGSNIGQLEEWDRLRGNVASIDYLKRKLQKLTARPTHDAESVRILAATVKQAQDFGVGSLPEIETAQQILHTQQKEVDERAERQRLSAYRDQVLLGEENAGSSS